MRGVWIVALTDCFFMHDVRWTLTLGVLSEEGTASILCACADASRINLLARACFISLVIPDLAGGVNPARLTARRAFGRLYSTLQ